MSGPNKISAFLLLFTLLMPPQGTINKTPTDRQTESAPPKPDQETALGLVQTQLDEVKSLKFDEVKNPDKAVSRITILIRSADLLWNYHEQTARAVFTEAYDLATRNYKQRDKGYRTDNSGLTINLPDQRRVVIEAIGRHDPTWAGSLAKLIKEEISKEAKETKSPGSTSGDRRNSVGMIGLALSLLPVDQQAAIDFAKASFNDSDPRGLPNFLFRLYEYSPASADSLCREAISAYANGPIRGLSYLLVYPFGIARVPIPKLSSNLYAVPEDFVANPNLQQFYLQALFNRAKASLNTPEQAASGSDLSPTAQMYITLLGMESLIAQYQPAYTEQALTLKINLGAAISSATRLQLQKESEGYHEWTKNDFDKNLEQAEREGAPAQRDLALVLAILRSPGTEALERLVKLAGKINDLALKSQLLNWIYFNYTLKSIKEGLLDEATQLAAKVDRIDQRAYLSFEIATEALKRSNDRQRAVELLDIVWTSATEASDTNEKARVLLGTAYLFAKFDYTRGIEVLTDAIKTINKINEPDLTTNRLIQSIKGTSISSYAIYEVSGFNLGAVFQEIGSSDFYGALGIAKNLEDVFLRSTAILALSASLLEAKRKP